MTYAAPHHLVADRMIEVRRTRAGDAWESGQGADEPDARVAAARPRHAAAMIIAIVGPTAVGKSDLAIDLAEMIDAEIVSADSMQVYVGMDIGTAKVSEADRRGVPTT